MINQVDIQKLAEFLNEANKNTYANKDASKVASSRLRSEDYHFEKDGFVYHDTYFGSRDFIGEEIVYKDDTPIWGANYFGFLLVDDVDKEDVYRFLRKALMQECKDILPVRGPKDFSDNGWRYTFSTEGNLKNFQGQEEIFLGGRVVYRCLVHGGCIY